jgi:prepilin-type N-terminal cleavage/methylation domain-containing protein
MKARGFSLVELMVGLALGLALLACALGAWSVQLSASRQLLAQSQLMHELRTSLHIISRNLRRAALEAPKAMTLLPGEYRFRYAPAGPKNEQHLAYRLHDGALEVKIDAGSWQTLTDARSVRIRALHIVPSSAIDTVAAAPCPLHTETRLWTVAITAHATRYPDLEHTLETTVGARDVAVTPSCPT